MRKLFSILTIGFLALTLTSCGKQSYEEKAWTWMRDKIDHFICPDEDRHALYFFDNKSLIYVDLETYEQALIGEVVSADGRETFTFDYATLNGYILPEDRGYEGSTSFVIAAEEYDRPRLIQEFALIYDTQSRKVRKICENGKVEICGDLILSATLTTGRGGQITAVDVYDAKGEKQTPKTFVGSIARQDVVVELVFSKSGSIAGSYYYAKYGPDSRLALAGSVDEQGNFEIIGVNNNDMETEEWEGVYKDGTMTAEFTNLYNHRSYDFQLVEKK